MRLPPMLQWSRAGARGRAEGTPQVALRVVLYEREAYQLPRQSSGVRVLRGRAWVTFAGRDTIMECSEELRLAPGRDYAVISSLGRSALVLEVLAAERHSMRSMIQAPQRNTAACEGC